MGRWFGWFQKDSVAELRNDRDRLVQKKAKIDEEISAIDKRIAKIERDNKDSN